MLVVVGGVLVIAAGTAAALGILNGTPSNPPAGAFSTPKSDERGAASGYAVSVTPNLQGGGVGWCVASLVYFQLGGAGGAFGCGFAPLPGRPIVALGGNDGGARDGDVYSATTSSVFVTTSQVAAVRVSPTLTILTRTDPQLPDHYRIAIYVHQAIAHHPIPAPRPGQSPPAVALDRAGKHIGLPASNRGEPRDPAVFWPSARAHTAPAGACEIDTNGLHAAYGEVVEHVHGFPQLTGNAYLSCASTATANGRGRGTLAAILLDAKHPGTTPAPLPDATPVPGHPQTFNEPGITPPTSTTLTPQGRPTTPHRPHPGPLSITGRRIGNAWLVVQSDGTLAQRLTVLDRLGICVRLTGHPCQPAHH
jgi:hypothetical protein